jgi:hypothetical protein
VIPIDLLFTLVPFPWVGVVSFVLPPSAFRFSPSAEGGKRKRFVNMHTFFLNTGWFDGSNTMILTGFVPYLEKGVLV